MGTKRQVEQRLLNLIKAQQSLHKEIEKTIISKIGGGVTTEELIFALPYVGAFSSQRGGFLLVSGANLFPGSIFFNQGPQEPGILVPQINSLQPIGVKWGNLVTKTIIPEIPNGQKLTPVRKFGLSN